MGLLEVLLGELVIVLLGDLLEEIGKLIPGNGTGFIGIELFEDIFPGWSTLLGVGAGSDSGDGGNVWGGGSDCLRIVVVCLARTLDPDFNLIIFNN